MSSPSRCSSRVADGFRNYLKRGFSRVGGRRCWSTGAAPDADGAGDDGAGRRPARARRQRRQSTARCLHQAAGALTNDFFVNLLDMRTDWTADSDAEDAVRRPRPRDRRAEVDRHARRSRLRLELAAARARGGLWQQRCAREVRARLRRGLDQGDEPRPFRSGLIPR